MLRRAASRSAGSTSVDNELVRELLAQHLGNVRVIEGGIPIAVFLAVASRVAVERPALRLKTRFEPARIAPELAPEGVPALPE